MHRWEMLVPVLLLLLLLLLGRLLLLLLLLLLHGMVSVSVDAATAGSLNHWGPLLVMLWGHRQPWSQRGQGIVLHLLLVRGTSVGGGLGVFHTSCGSRRWHDHLFERLQRVDGSGGSGRRRGQFGDRHGLLRPRALDVSAAGAGQVRMRGHRGRERRLWGLRRDDTARWLRRGHDGPWGHLRMRGHLGWPRRHLG